MWAYSGGPKREHKNGKSRECRRTFESQTTLLGATCFLRLAAWLRPVKCCWLKFEGQIWANNTQHLATRRNRVAKRAQIMFRYVVLTCCDRLAGAKFFQNCVEHAWRKAARRFLFSSLPSSKTLYSIWKCICRIDFDWRK